MHDWVRSHHSGGQFAWDARKPTGLFLQPMTRKGHQGQSAQVFLRPGILFGYPRNLHDPDELVMSLELVPVFDPGLIENRLLQMPARGVRSLILRPDSLKSNHRWCKWVRTPQQYEAPHHQSGF